MRPVRFDAAALARSTCLASPYLRGQKGAVEIELLNKLIKSHVFTVLPTASQANWS
jgi:hypothetical protein